MGVTKSGQAYAAPAAINDNMLVEVPADYVRKIDTAGANLTVVKTAIGAAQRVAVFLDRSDWPEIVGTVSGDDTIFIATRDARGQKQLIAKLKNALPG